MEKLIGSSSKLLTSFDGTTPVEHFICELNQVLDELRNDEDACISMLRRSLKGEAKFLFCDYLVKDQDKSHTASIDEWKDRLRQKFKRRFDIQYREMVARKMKSSESAHQYVSAILTLASSLKPQLPDIQMVMLMQENLLPKYKQMLLLMCPSTPAEFEDKLSTAMAFMRHEEEEAARDLNGRLVVKERRLC